ncbi:MAG: acetyl-CoA C-acyltransferase [Gammaproteobacteria bacterium]|nr:acetyl-CoA C-acyltransferase [Gammaproteobacteria bacterium]
MSQEEVVIVAARRTPIGSFQGALSRVAAPELASTAIRACIADTGLESDAIDQAMIGCVLQAGVGQAPARQAVLNAGLSEAVDCTTINKVCGSAMRATTLAADLLAAGHGRIAVAGGMESMSNAPYLLPKARGGYRMGHQQALDHMFFDGLQNAYDQQMMGNFGEQTARKYDFSREAQDEFAIASVERALAAIASGAFDAEIAPVTVSNRHDETVVDTDEEPGRCAIDKIPGLRPAFAEDGTVTAATSSSIADGAAILILTTAAVAAQRDLPVLARIVAHSSHSHAPEWFTTAPVSALRKLHEQTGWSTADVDLYEINEAFACVTMAAMQELGIDHSRVNVNGGSCALGHPIGATGARIITTLIHALRDRGGQRGIAALCIGGGEALAIGIEIP